jgi:putative ABC transport system ATP-binding protein
MSQRTSNPTERAPILSVRNVTKQFETPAGSIDVLRGIDLDAAAGDSVAIVGASGSGKSTLLSLLAGLDLPTSGSIEVAGRDLARMSEGELARYRSAQLGIVFQQFHLMSGLTALENVSLPLDLEGVADAEERAAVVLEQVGLRDRATHRPGVLSGGECQRVAIARALIVEPAVLLADEPSGSLDPRTGARVEELLFELTERRGTSLVLVTHSDSLAERCDRCLQLVDGRLR